MAAYPHSQCDRAMPLGGGAGIRPLKYNEFSSRCPIFKRNDSNPTLLGGGGAFQFLLTNFKQKGNFMVKSRKIKINLDPILF